MGNLFERLSANQLSPAAPSPTKEVRELPPAQKLLDWLRHRNKPTISARDICVYGPNSIRNPKSAIEAAEVLVKAGWLIPDPTPRRNMYKWQVVQKPVVYPIVAAETVR